MRYIRAIRGRALEIDLDTTETSAVLSWGDDSHTLTIVSGVCTIPASVSSQTPVPGRPGAHYNCRLTFGGKIWCVQFLRDNSHHLLEVKHRWPST